MEEINNDKEKTNEEVKEYSFAKYLSNLREKRNLTQKALAEKIQVSDRTISKWENGFTVPDLHNIRAICKELGVSANSVVLEKNSLSDYIRKFFQLLMKLWKHIFNNIVKLIFLVIFILLLIYFINNYNSVSIYILNYDSNDIKIGNGYFIRSKSINILLIDNITINVDEYSSLNTELYTLVNGDKITLYESSNLDDIFLEELSGYPDALDKDILRAITQNLYLDITVYNSNGDSKTYKCRINFKKNFSNNKLIYSSYQINNEYNNDYQRFLNGESSIENISYKSFNSNINYHYSNLLTDAEVSKTNATPENDSDNKLKDLGYTYNKESDTYTKVDDSKTITYNPEFKVLITNQNINGYENKISYYIEKGRIYYQGHDNNKQVVRFKYFVNDKLLECIIGNCENYLSDIDYILKEYQAISEIL